MEGIGYWLFLLVLYLISGLMRKRRQRRQIPQEGEPDLEESGKSGLFKFPEDFFGSEDEEEEEPESVVLEKLPIEEDELDSEIPEWFDEVSEERVPEPAVSEMAAHSPDVGWQDIWKTTGYNIRSAGTQPILDDIIFESKQDLRKAIIMKEILDPPRALKRRIR